MSTVFAISAYAKDLDKGKPSSVVLVQEVGSTWHVWFNHFCPLSSVNTFSSYCKKRVEYNFQFYQINPNVDWVKSDKYKYFIQWTAPKPKGRYAYAYSTRGNNSASIKNETLVATIAPGTVLIRSFFEKGTKTEKAAVIARTKAIFKREYGTLADKMTYKVFDVVNVKCLKRSETPKNQDNCKLVDLN